MSVKTQPNRTTPTKQRQSVSEMQSSWWKLSNLDVHQLRLSLYSHLRCAPRLNADALINSSAACPIYSASPRPIKQATQCCRRYHIDPHPCQSLFNYATGVYAEPLQSHALSRLSRKLMRGCAGRFMDVVDGRYVTAFVAWCCSGSRSTPGDG